MWSQVLCDRTDASHPVLMEGSDDDRFADGEGLARRFQEAGLVEYPGYGLAAKQGPSETGIYMAAETALEYLRRQLDVPRERTVLQGQPLGSGMAVDMAKRGHGSRLVLIMPYTSIVDMVVGGASYRGTTREPAREGSVRQRGQGSCVEVARAHRPRDAG